MKSKKSYLGFVLWIFGMVSAQLSTVLLPKMDSHLQIVIYMKSEVFRRDEIWFVAKGNEQSLFKREIASRCV